MYISSVLVFSISIHLLQDLVCLEKEISMLQDLQHNRIVTYYGTRRQKDCVQIFMEYMAGVGVHIPYSYVVALLKIKIYTLKSSEKTQLYNTKFF